MKMRLAPRIVLFFTVLAAVLLASVGVLSYRGGSESLKNAAMTDMVGNAIEKEAQLDTWIEERLDDIGQIAGRVEVAEEAARLIAAAPASEKARSARAILLQELEPTLTRPRSAYTELFVMEPEGGKVVASTSPKEEGNVKLGQPYFLSGKTGPYLQTPYRSVGFDVPLMTEAVPLFAADGRVVAVLAARLNLAVMNTVVRRRTGLHQTEDSFLFNAGQFPLTQPLFIREPAVLGRRLDTEAVRRCVAGSSGVILAPDYRGAPSIAAYRWNARRQLGLIVEMDQAEALVPARAFGWSVVLISSLALLATSGLAFLLARTIIRPLLTLYDKVLRFGEGSGIRVSLKSPGDEVRVLTREFDRMAARVAEHTGELARTNEALQAENAERKRAEEKAMRFSAMVENSGEYISMANPDGKVFYLNPAGRRLSGITQDTDVSSINWRDLFDDENWKLRLEVAIPAVRATGHWEGQIRMRNLQTGRMLDLFVNAFRVNDPLSGAPVCIATVQRDITETKRAEEELRQREHVLSESQRLGHIGSWLFDMKGQMSWSEEVYRLFGVSPETFIPTSESLLSLIHPDDRPAMQEWIAACAAGEKPAELESRFVMPDGTFRVFMSRGEAVLDAGNRFIRMAGTVQDITERKRAETEMQRFRAELEQRVADAVTANESLHRQTEELRRLNAERAALGCMNELLPACTNADEAYEIFGRAAAGLFPSLNGALHIFAASRNQLAPVAMWGEWPEAALLASPEDCWGLRRGKVYLGNGTTTPPCGHAGPARGLATVCVPLTAYGEVLGVLHLRGSDASKVQSMLQLASMAGDGLVLTVANLRLRGSLEAQSIRDPLTDLFNRRYLTEILEREFARAQRSGAPGAVIMIDVDHFKRFNDTFGHEAGDAVLRELGKLFRRSIRAEDIACRYGGEEFCLVLPQMDRDGARQRAEAIRAEAAQLEVKVDGRSVGPVTLSLGVALFSEDAMTAALVLAVADASLYQAKREGRNRVIMSRAAGAPDITAAA